MRKIRQDKPHRPRKPTGKERLQVGEKRRCIDPTTSEPDYTDEQRDFLIALERYKTMNRRPWPTWREVLEIMHALGYRRVCARQPLPGWDAAHAAAKGERLT